MNDNLVQNAKTADLIAARVIFLITLFPLILWYAYVGTVLWSWFITPTFGVIAPGLWTFSGIILLVNLPFTTHYIETSRIPKEKQQELKTVWGTALNTILTSALWPAGALFFGWIYHALGG